MILPSTLTQHQQAGTVAHRVPDGGTHPSRRARVARARSERVLALEVRA